MTIGKRAAAAVCALLMLWAGPLPAQTYPSKPIKMVVPYAAGGGLDMMCRVVAERLASSMQQSVIVENRPGASGTIGTAFVARSSPDGYTFGCGTNSEMTLAEFVLPGLPYDPSRDLAPLTMGVKQAVVLVAHPSLPASTLAELVDLARRQPVFYGHLGAGHSFYLAMAMLAAQEHVTLHGIPYKGAANSVSDVLAGHIQLAIVNLAPVVQYTRDGKLKALAVFGTDRNPALPDVPSVEEALGIDAQAPSWFGFFAPSGVPPDVQRRLVQELRLALADPGARAKLHAAHMEVMDMTSEEFRDVVARERSMNAGLVRRFAVKSE